MRTDIETGMQVIRCFLATVFGVAAVTGLAILVERSSMLWSLFVGLMVLVMAGLSGAFIAAVFHLWTLPVRRQRLTRTYMTLVERVDLQLQLPAEPKPEQASRPAMTPVLRETFEEHVARVRQQREYWRQKLLERRGGKS